MKKKFKLLIFVIMIIFITPTIIYAEDATFTCLNNNTYHIQNSSGATAYRNLENITENDLKGKTVKIEKSGIEYEIELPERCYCSGDSEENYSNCLENYTLDAKKTIKGKCKSKYSIDYYSEPVKCYSYEDNGTTHYETCNNKFTFSINSDVYNGSISNPEYRVTFKVKDEAGTEITDPHVVGYFNLEKGNFGLMPDDFTGNDKNPVQADKITIGGTTFSPNTKNSIYFYTSSADGSCAGTYLGYIDFTTPNKVYSEFHFTDVKVDSMTDKQKKCYNFVNEDHGKYLDLAKKMVPECYAGNELVEKTSKADDDKFGSAYLKKRTASDVQDEIDNFNEIVKIMEGASAIKLEKDNLSCKFNIQEANSDNNVKKYSYADILESTKKNEWWKAVCTETITIEYDDPKLVDHPGAGFNYQTKMNIERTCTAVQVKTPTKKVACQYGVECFGGPLNHQGDPNAGPNGDFDDCIIQCDGGNYTQSCINQCYSKVYLQSSNIFKKNNDRVTYFDTFNNIKKISDDGSYGLDNGHCNYEYTNKYGTKFYGCYTNHGVYYQYSTYCGSGSNPAKCYEIQTSGDGCVDPNKVDIETEYNQQVAAAEADKTSVLADMKKFETGTIENEEYSITISEEYDQKKNGKFNTKETTYSGTGKDSNTIFVKDSVSKTNPQNNNCTTSDLTTTCKRSLIIGVGPGVIDRITGLFNQKVVTETKDGKVSYKYETYQITNKKFDNLNSDTSFKKKYLADYLYFTDLRTNTNVNDAKNWPYVNNEITKQSSIDYSSYTKNIKVKLTKIGSWNQWGTSGVNIDCFYGIYPTNSGPYYCEKVGDKYYDIDGNVVDTEDAMRNSCKCYTKDANYYISYNNIVPQEEYRKSCGKECTKIGGNSWQLLDGKITFDYNEYLAVCKGIENNGDFIFRVIDLNDVFPNEDSGRIPRYNWSTEAIRDKKKSLYTNEEVNPIKLTEEIQNSGNDIYDNVKEIDYEFTLTRKQISTIKKYNKGKNYIDYNGMYCELNNNNQVCYSNFLDNADYITFTDSSGVTIPNTSRKSIAKCNNALSGNCDINKYKN